VRKTQKRRGRGPAKFKKTDVTRAANAILAAGLPVREVKVDPHTGQISVLVGEPGEAIGNDLDHWLATKRQ
jgi:hypothetical protein